jgi:hypothetical protein
MSSDEQRMRKEHNLKCFLSRMRAGKICNISSIKKRIAEYNTKKKGTSLGLNIALNEFLNKKVGTLQKALSCSICLMNLIEPRMLHCGHAFCHKCIDGHLENHSVEFWSHNRLVHVVQEISADEFT